ncbi:MAG: hypothetical protein K9M54_11725 [Kiritimatiellales bacterium]|nr:hypothetical protein [Kiritimatiellales bacterium]
MKRKTLTALLVATIVGTGFIAQAAEQKAKAQTTCPVMGEKVDKTQYVDVNGYRIYTCCPGCIGKIKANPDKYIKQMEAQGIELEKTPAAKEKQDK